MSIECLLKKTPTQRRRAQGRVKAAQHRAKRGKLAEPAQALTRPSTPAKSRMPRPGFVDWGQRAVCRAQRQWGERCGLRVGGWGLNIRHVPRPPAPPHTIHDALTLHTALCALTSVVFSELYPKPTRHHHHRQPNRVPLITYVEYRPREQNSESGARVPEPTR